MDVILTDLKPDDIDDGAMKKVIINDMPIAIVRLEDEYFALDDICSHAECSFSDRGYVEEGNVVCGCHGARFDTKSGKPLTLPATKPVATYAVYIKEDVLAIAIEKE